MPTRNEPRRATGDRVGPDEYRGTAALRASLRRFLRGSEHTVRAHGLTPQRYDLLLAIKGAPDGSERATITDLCRWLGLAQSSATQLARRTEDLGLLRRELSARDARVRYLRLTAKGERRLAGAVAALRTERERLAAALIHLTEEADPGTLRTVSARPSKHQGFFHESA